MFNNLKNSLAHFWVMKKYAKKNPPVISFNNFFSKSVYYLVIMPSDGSDFNHSLSILKFFTTHKKNVTIFVPEISVNLIPARSKFKFITFTDEQVSKLNLPSSPLVRQLKKKSFDVVIDLNLGESVFSSAVANIVETNFKIGFVKRNSDTYYNLQFINHKNNSEFSYKNLLNSLSMF